MSWEKVKLGNVTNNLDGRRIPLNEMQRREKETQKLYPYIGANNILGFIDEYIFDEKILCIAEDGGSWGKNQKCSFIVNEKCWVNNHAHVITAKKGVSLEYLMNFLNYSDLNKYITGTTRGKLTKSALNSIEIPLPPLPIQQKIAAILDQADALRKKDQQLLAKYDELLQAVFYDMFGDYISLNNDKTSLFDLVEINPRKSEINVDDNYLVSFVPMACVGEDGEFDCSIIRKFGEVKTGFTYFKEKDVLFAKITPCMENGKGAIATGLKNNIGFGSTEFHVFRPNEKITSSFIYSLLTQKKIRQFAEINMTGSAGQKRVPVDFFKKLKLKLPPIKLQYQFDIIAKNISQQKQQVKQQTEQSETLFQSLLQRAFKGELVK